MPQAAGKLVLSSLGDSVQGPFWAEYTSKSGAESVVFDPLFGKGSIRGDGRAIHDMYLYEVKTPAESTGEWDLYKEVATISGEDAFLPMLEECDFTKQ